MSDRKLQDVFCRTNTGPALGCNNHSEPVNNGTTYENKTERNYVGCGWIAGGLRSEQQPDPTNANGRNKPGRYRRAGHEGSGQRRGKSDKGLRGPNEGSV